MGRVLRVRDQDLQRDAALKLLLQASDKRHQDRFLREAQIGARIRHPNVVQVYDFGIADGLPYLVMEYVQGRSLDHVKNLGEPLSPMLAIAAALEALHAEGMVHRDLKPANVLLSRDGRVLLTDFGLARDPDRTALTATGRMLGTLPYMAPECLRGEEATTASDWWSWGVTLYELSEGDLPFNRDQVFHLAGKTTESISYIPFRDPDGPIARAVRACLKIDPTERPQGAADLKHLVAQESPEPLTPLVRPTSAVVALATLATLTVGAFLITPRVSHPSPPGTRNRPARSRLQSLAVTLAEELQGEKDLAHSDPWIWAPARTRSASYGPFAAELVRRYPLSLTDGEAQALDKVDQIVTASGASPLLEPLFAVRATDKVVPRPVFPHEKAHWIERLPKTATGYLGRSYEIAPALFNSSLQLTEDVTDFFAGRPLPETFPFDSEFAGVQLYRRSSLLWGKLLTSSDLRRRARAWFRPTTRHCSLFFATLGASLRQEPSQRFGAFFLGSQSISLLSPVWYSYLGATDPTALLGGAPSSPEGWCLRAQFLARRWTLLRRAATFSETVSRELEEAVLRSLEGTHAPESRDRVYEISFRILAKRARVEGNFEPLRSLLQEHLPGHLERVDPADFRMTAKNLLEAWDDAPNLTLIAPETVRLMRDVLSQNSASWFDTDSKRDEARWRTRLESRMP